jgi:hypothetical protein
LDPELMSESDGDDAIIDAALGRGAGGDDESEELDDQAVYDLDDSEEEDEDEDEDDDSEPDLDEEIERGGRAGRRECRVW